MLRIVPNKRLICALAFPFGFFSNEASDGEISEISPMRVAIDKFKDLVVTENGAPTKETQSVINATMAGTISGFFLGGILRARNVPERFQKENQAVLYEHKFNAYKQLQIQVGREFLRGAVPVAAKLGVFCFMFSSISTGLYMYRGKYDILNYICGGTLTGFLYKLNMGLKGALAGGVVGFMLGSVSGALTSSILLITGYDMDNLYEAGTAIPNARREQIKQKCRKQRQEEEEEFLRQMYAQAKT